MKFNIPYHKICIEHVETNRQDEYSFEMDVWSAVILLGCNSVAA